MLPIVTVEQTRQIEAAADADGLSYATMMENAGRAVAERAVEIIDAIGDPRITILIGKGNNGGDGLVTGRYIAKHRTDAEVRFYLLEKLDDDDPNFVQVQEMGLFVAYAEDDHDGRVLRNMVASADLVIDALFGIGARLPIKDDAAKMMRNVNKGLRARQEYAPEELTLVPHNPTHMKPLASQTVLAIDCPSGLDCDTGEMDSNIIHADETMTFIAPKIGMLTYPGAEAVGRLRIATIGVPNDLAEIQSISHRLVTGQDVKNMLPERTTDSNKGTYGKTMVVGGSVNYSGAAILAAKAAYRAGAGLVTVGGPAPLISTLAAQVLEPTWLMLAHDMGVLSEKATSVIFKEIQGYKALLLGPGWGQEETTGTLLKQLLEKPDDLVKKRNPRNIGFGIVEDDASDNDDTGGEKFEFPPLIIDADGLNLLAKIDDWWKLLPENTIITPHPGEMGRLSNMETSEIQANRWQIAEAKAKEWGVILVLKGAYTVIASPEGKTATLPFKTDALATAGTGDVLAGLIAGMRSQGLSAFDAAVVGGYIHGLAGEIAASQYGSGRGIIASDVMETIPAALGIVESL